MQAKLQSANFRGGGGGGELIAGKITVRRLSGRRTYCRQNYSQQTLGGGGELIAGKITVRKLSGRRTYCRQNYSQQTLGGGASLLQAKLQSANFLGGGLIVGKTTVSKL